MCFVYDLNFAGPVRKYMCVLIFAIVVFASYFFFIFAAPVSEDGIPRSFLCPVTLTIMKDPVILADGHRFFLFVRRLYMNCM